MRNLRRFVKAFASKALLHSGLLAVVAARRLRARCAVLMYHRVIRRSRQEYCHSSPGIVVYENTFRRHIAFLTKYFRILTIADLEGHLDRHEPISDRSCLITFDDGWKDNFDVAFPILTQHKVPAAIFLPYAFIGSDRVFWQEDLSAKLTLLLRSQNPADRRFVKHLLRRRRSPSVEDVYWFIQRVKQGGAPAISSALKQVSMICANRNLPEHDDRYLDWEEVNAMQSQGVTFGSHCISHRVLTELPEGEKREEIIDSRGLLGSRLGRDVDVIAYPNGNYDAQVLSLAKEAGFRLGFGTRPGFVSTGTSALALPRINIHEGAAKTEAELLCTILGLW